MAIATDFLGRARDPRLGLVADADERVCLLCRKVGCAHDPEQRYPARVVAFAFVVLRPVLPGWPVQEAFALDGQPATYDAHDIVEIVHAADGDDDGPSSLVVARLRDGRWVYASHHSTITGDPYTTIRVAATYDEIWHGAMTEDDRDRVIAQLRGERRAEELVRLDGVLEHATGETKWRAEARMLRLQDPDDQP